MNRDPKVTVITCSFNSDDYLSISLKSIMNQKYQRWNCLVLDDANLESTKKLIDSLNDPRVSYIPNPINLGIALNHQKGIMASNTEYICFLNQDDAFDPDYLLEAVSELDKNSDCCGIFFDHWVMDFGGRVLNEQSELLTKKYRRDKLSVGKHLYWFNLLVNLSVPTALSLVFRKSALTGDWRSTFGTSGPAYDFFVSALLYKSSMPILYKNIRYNYYRVHSDSETSKGNPSWVYGTLNVYEFISNMPIPNRYHAILNKKRSAAFFSASKIAWKFDHSVGLQFAAKSFWLCPGIKNTILLAGSIIRFLVRKFI